MCLLVSDYKCLKMDKHTVMKSFYSLRSKRYEILVCIALFIILKYTRKGTISIVYRPIIESDIYDFGMNEEEHMSYNTKGISDNKNSVNGSTYRDINNEVLNLARKITSFNKTVLVSVINDAYLPFAYSWLCNTKDMDIHKSVLVITTDNESKIKLNRDWPDVSVFHLRLQIPKGDQKYSHVGYVKIMIRRTEIILSLLQADIDMLLLEFDYVWFSNPIPGLQKRFGVDMLVNPVSNTGGTIFNGGLLYLFATNRTKALWSKLTEMMRKLERDIKDKPDNKSISEGYNDQTFLSQLIRARYANITTQLLTLDVYADGKWYSMSNAERQKLHPIVISNNWIIEICSPMSWITGYDRCKVLSHEQPKTVNENAKCCHSSGNKNKIIRAKKWNHWFLRPDNTCDMDTVKKIVYSEV